MSREHLLIKEIRDRLNELESLLNNPTIPKITTTEPINFQISDSTLTSNGTIFQITHAQKIELCKIVVKTTDPQINIKRFVDKEEPSRCICYCLVKEIVRRETFLSEGENLYYDESNNKYYSQCRMPCIKDNNNNCNRHTGAVKIDISRMKILTNPSYNLSLDQSIKDYCKMYLSPSLESEAPNKAPVESPKPAPINKALVKKVPVDSPKPAPINKVPVEAPNPSPINKGPVKSSKPAPVKKPAPIKKTPVESPKLKENSDIESSSCSDSENESSSGSGSGSDSEVDMIVSKVIESLKVPSEDESFSEEDSDDCMLDADEIHDEEGNTYYIDEAKSVIKLDEEGYGVRLGMLKEFKSGNIFYKNKSWKIDYFPKK